MNGTAQISTKGLYVGNLLFGLLVLLWLMLPFRLWKKFVFPNQIEIIVVVTYMAVFILTVIIYNFVKSSSGFKLKFSNIDIVFLIYVSYIFCRYLFQYQTINAEYVFEGFSLIVLYVFYRNLSLKIIVYCLCVFPWAGIIQIIYGICNQTGNFSPGYSLSDITGIFYNTGILGGFVAIVSVVTLGLTLLVISSTPDFKVNVRPILKVLFIILVCVFAIQLIASGSRAAWCCSLTGSLYIAVSYLNLHKKVSNFSLLRRAGFAVMTIFLVLLFFYSLYLYKTDSANGRLLIWKISCGMIRDMPAFGFGPSGFQANYMEYQALYFKNQQGTSLGYLAGDNHYAFNEFLRIWIEQGLVGLVLLVLLLYFLLVKKKSAIDFDGQWITFIARASILAITVFSLFSYPFEFLQFKVMAVFFAAIVSGNSEGLNNGALFFSQKFHKSYIKHQKLLKTIIVTIWLATSLILIQSVYNYAYACNKWDYALKNIYKKSDDIGIKILKMIKPKLRNNGIFLSTFGKALNIKGQYDDAITVLGEANQHLSSVANYIELGKTFKAIGDFDHAKTAWTKASIMIPSMFTPRYLMAKMFFENGDTAAALQMTNELLNKEIKIWTPELQSILDELKELSIALPIDIIYP